MYEYLCIKELRGQFYANAWRVMPCELLIQHVATIIENFLYANAVVSSFCQDTVFHSISKKKFLSYNNEELLLVYLYV